MQKIAAGKTADHTKSAHTQPCLWRVRAGRGSALIPGAGGPGAGLEPEPLDPAALAAREAEAAAAAAALLQELEAEAAAKAAKAAKKKKKGEGQQGWVSGVAGGQEDGPDHTNIDGHTDIDNPKWLLWVASPVCCFCCGGGVCQCHRCSACTQRVRSPGRSVALG